MKKLYLLLAVVIVLCGCSSSEDNPPPSSPRSQKGEFIYRKHNESIFIIPPLKKTNGKVYPWNKGQHKSFPQITKEFFRCKGSYLNPYRTTQIKQETFKQYDCNGSDKHSLPLRDGKEFIYPVLIELMNQIQDTLGKKVVITSGHRCPDHNKYIDLSSSNQYSKHMIGAEVSFYVQGLEEQPEKIIKLIQNFYKLDPQYTKQPDYQEFKRFENKDIDVSIPPWFNKEIFIKLYLKHEGRNFDNRHPYPYISVQVRHDRERNERVTYSWDKAFKCYQRW